MAVLPMQALGTQPVSSEKASHPLFCFETRVM